MHHVIAVVAQVRDKATIVPGRCSDKRSITILLSEPVIIRIRPAKRMPARIRQSRMPACRIIAVRIARRVRQGQTAAAAIRIIIRNEFDSVHPPRAGIVLSFVK